MTGLDLSAPIWRWRGGSFVMVTRRFVGACRGDALWRRQFPLSSPASISFTAAAAGAACRGCRDRPRAAAGRTAIFVDSLQIGDEPDYDAMLEWFPVAFHEPYYASYLRENLDRLLGPGFARAAPLPAYFSKVVTYRREPGQG